MSPLGKAETGLLFSFGHVQVVELSVMPSGPSVAHFQGVTFLSESSILAIDSVTEFSAGSLQTAWTVGYTVVDMKSPVFAQVV